MTYIINAWSMLISNTGTIAVTLGNMLVLFCYLRPRWKWWIYPVLVGIALLSMPLVFSLYSTLFGMNNYSLFLACLGYFNDILILISFRERFFETITLIFALSILNRLIVFWGYILYTPLNNSAGGNMNIKVFMTLVIAAVYFAIILVCWLFLKDKGRLLIKTKLPHCNWGVLAGISVSAKLIIDFCSDYAFNLNSYSNIQIIWAMIALCTFVAAVLGLYLYSSVTTLNRLELQSAAGRLVFEKEAQQRYYEALLHNQEELHRMKHDMRGHLTTISRLLSDGNKEAAVSYLSELMEYTENHQKKIYSDDPYINAVVTNYSTVFTENSITFEHDILPVSLEMHQVEICLALNNALQNALEASLKLPIEKRYVRLQIKGRHNHFLFRVINNFDGKLIMENGLPISTKKEKGHGYGLASIRSAAEPIGGFVVCKSEGDVFIIDVAI